MGINDEHLLLTSSQQRRIKQLHKQHYQLHLLLTRLTLFLSYVYRSSYWELRFRCWRFIENVWSPLSWWMFPLVGQFESSLYFWVFMVFVTAFTKTCNLLQRMPDAKMFRWSSFQQQKVEWCAYIITVQKWSFDVNRLYSLTILSCHRLDVLNFLKT